MFFFQYFQDILVNVVFNSQAVVSKTYVSQIASTNRQCCHGVISVKVILKIDLLINLNNELK